MLLGSLATGVHAQTIERQIFTGTDPDSVAVNPVTNRIYVANESSSTVTVLDGRTYATLATINVPGYFGGSDFLGLTVNLTIAVNPVTNKVYVASQNANAVIVIDENNIITTVPTDVGPTSLAINTVTNKVYVANIHDITTIDGATNATSTVAFGAASTNVWGIAVNPTTNRVYAVGTNGNLQGQMLIINGATNGTQILALPDEDPFAVAVNQATNKIYTANAASGTVSIIDGVTNEMSTVAVGNAPVAVAVDEPANAVYVANSSAGTVSIINGSSNAVSTVTVGTKPAGFAINTLADQVYVIDLDQQEISIINGANGKVTGSIPVSAVSLAFNPVTNRLLTAGTVLSVIDVSTYRNHLLTPPLGTNSIAVNPVTNKIYAGSASQSTVFVYNGTTEALLKSIPVSSGTGSLVMALNTITNKIYAANAFSNQVAVINGNTDTVEATVNTGTSPVELVVDPIRNKIYVANQGSASVTIIDGETNSATSIAAGNSPVSIDVNTRSGQVCVGNQGDRSVTLIDGNTLSTTTVKIPFSFSQVIANQTANTAYVISSGIGVISNGALETTITVPSHGVAAAALEPLTDQLFAVDSAGSLYAIDGVTNALSAGGPPTNQQPVGLAIDPVTYKLYSLNFSTTATTAYDGASQTPFNIQAGAGNATAIPSSVGVNAVTQRVYIAGTPSITVIEEAQGTSPLTATISPLAGNATSVATPQFTFTAFNLFQSQKLPATNVYYQFDTWQGPWIQAMANGSGSFAANAAPLSPGVHVLYAYALDGEEAVSIDGGGGWITPAYGAVTGAIASYGFNVLVSPPATNVSGEVTVTRGGFRLDRSTGYFVQVLTVANSSNAVLQGPISLVLDDLSTKATLSDANGVTAEALPAGSPYLNLNLGTVNVLNPGQSVSVTLEFVDPSMQGISYSTRVLAGAGGR